MNRARALLLPWCSLLICAQPAPEFEVASVRAHPGQAGVAFGISGTNVTVESPPMLGLISMAYGVEPDQVIGGPAWMNTDRFDIRAKAPGDAPPTRQQAGLMLQNLLSDRFQLKLHREKRERPVYLLVVDKNGPKLKAAAGDTKSVRVGGGEAVTTIKASHVSMDDLAKQLSGPGAGRPVIDKTGLSGTYDFELTWSPWMTDADTKAGAPPSIFTAIRALGLKLEPGKGPAEVLVIDHVEKPSEN